MNRAPEWTPGMDRITGMAAHPSMQKKTDQELEERAIQYRTALGEPLPTSAEARKYREHLRALLAATDRALEWRRSDA
jgi:hypothetical protein